MQDNNLGSNLLSRNPYKSHRRIYSSLRKLDFAMNAKFQAKIKRGIPRKYCIGCKHATIPYKSMTSIAVINVSVQRLSRNIHENNQFEHRIV